MLDTFPKIKSKMKNIMKKKKKKKTTKFKTDYAMTLYRNRNITHETYNS